MVPNRLTDRKAIQVRHGHIQQDQVRGLLRPQEGFPTALGSEDLVALAGEKAGQHGDDVRLIVYDE